MDFSSLAANRHDGLERASSFDECGRFDRRGVPVFAASKCEPTERCARVGLHGSTAPERRALRHGWHERRKRRSASGPLQSADRRLDSGQFGYWAPQRIHGAHARRQRARDERLGRGREPSRRPQAPTNLRSPHAYVPNLRTVDRRSVRARLPQLCDSLERRHGPGRWWHCAAREWTADYEHWL